MPVTVTTSRARRAALLVTLAAAAFPGVAAPVVANDPLPVGPLTLIVGWPAGGPSDSVARLIAAQMAGPLGHPVVVDNRGGAGGNIGSEAAARAKTDGSVIMLATASSHGLNSALYSRLGYDPIRDFAPVGIITTSPGVLLVPVSSPFHSVQELVQAARAQPGKLNYGSGGIGSSQHLAGANFRKVAGVDVAHIPFKGTAAAMTDLMAARVDFVITTGAIAFVRSGKLRPLAVAAHRRLPALPGVPTFEEAGIKGFYTDSWYGLVAPARTPRPALAKLNAALNMALRDPAVQKQLSDQGSLPVEPMTPEAFWQFVQKQMPSAAEEVRVSGAKAE